MTDIDPRSRNHPNHPTLAFRAHQWAIDGMLEEVVWDNEAEELGELLEHAMLDILCARYGHKVVDDQCMKPDHRYCVWCSRRMPNLPVGRIAP